MSAGQAGPKKSKVTNFHSWFSQIKQGMELESISTTEIHTKSFCTIKSSYLHYQMQMLSSEAI